MDHQRWSPVVAFLVVAAAVTGVVAVGDDTPVEHVSPVGEAESLGITAGTAVVLGIAAGTYAWHEFRSDPADELGALDGKESKTTTYDSMKTVLADRDILNQSYANYLEDTRMIARLEAKGAYIRALENGSTEASARLAAHEAVDDYYSVKQEQLLNSWTVQIEHQETMHSQIWSDSNVSTDYITGTYGFDEQYYRPAVHNNISYQTSRDITLANGSSMSVPIVTVDFDYDHNNDDDVTDGNVVLSAGPNDDQPTKTNDFGDNIWVESVTVKKPYAEFSGDSFEYLSFGPNPYNERLGEIETQISQVDDDVNDFVNETYSAWEAGTINASDLVDPYLAARDYSPDAQFDTWSLRTLTSLGYNSPLNLSQFGNMTVVDEDEDTTYNGILLSDGLPESGSFQVGTTYDAANLTGLQFVQESDGTHELAGNFTISDAYNASGGQLDSVDYRSIDYNSTNLTEYKATLEDLRSTLAEANARQEKLRNAGGGGGLFGDLFGGLFGGLGSAAKIVLIGGGVLVAARVFGGS